MRAKLARELHDAVVQDLATILVDLENFRRDQHGRDSVLSEIDDLQRTLRQVMTNLRQVVYDLRGIPGADANLGHVLRNGLISEFGQRSGIEAVLDVDADWPSVLPTDVALNMYRIVQEALTNVERHAGATRVEVRLGVSDAGRLFISVADNGRGLGAHTDTWREGLGLIGIEERALLLGGRATLTGRPGGGAVLVVSFPPSAEGVRDVG